MINNNFGTGGYGQADNTKAATMATGASNPWAAVAQLLVGKAAQNIGGSIDDSHTINQQVNTKGARDINAEHSSPFGVSDEMGSQMMPGAEKMLSANTKPLEVAPGSFNQQPISVDSSQQSWGPANYLNYMQYPRG